MRSIIQNAFRRFAAGTERRGRFIGKGGRLMRSIIQNTFRRFAAGTKRRGRFIEKGGVFMAFFASFIQTAIKFILMAAVAGCGLFFGKKLRDRKDAKTAAEELTAKEK